MAAATIILENHFLSDGTTYQGMFRTGMPDHVFIRFHVVFPVLSFADILYGEFPNFFWIIQSFQQPLSLFLGRDVKEKFLDRRTVAGQIAVKSADVLVSLLPDCLGDEGFGDFLFCQEFRVNPHDEYLLIIGAVKNTDAAPLRQRFYRAPEVVIQKVP
jgi:hypothetical protein